MTLSIVSRISALALFSLAACNGNLTVVDDLVHEAADPTVDNANPPPSEPTNVEPLVPANGPCGCVTSPSLMPLVCNGQKVPLLDNDIVQVSRDGGAAAFNLTADTDDFASAYFVAYWDGTRPAQLDGVPDTQLLPSDGMVLGLNASGDRVLVSGGDGVQVFERGGSSHSFPLQMTVGRGSLSADGRTITAATYTDNLTNLARANVDTGEVETLATFAATPDTTVSVDRAYVTPDASTVVGSTTSWGADLTDLSSVPFRWNGNGLTTTFPGVDPALEIWPESVSADGSVIAGRSPTTQQHFRWSAADGYQELARASWRSETLISADGSVVLGSLNPGDVSDSAAFRWTAQTGAVNLTPGLPSLATALSEDGNVAVAYSWDDEQFAGAAPRTTYIWDSEHGTRTLKQLLKDRGVDMTGWQFEYPRALSANGKVLLGIGHCGDVPTLYRVVLSN